MKLNVLAKKYFEKKAKKGSSLSVGDTPQMTPGSLERCVMAEVYPRRIVVNHTHPSLVLP